jgi:hypothetical protein
MPSRDKPKADGDKQKHAPFCGANGDVASLIILKNKTVPKLNFWNSLY